LQEKCKLTNQTNSTRKAIPNYIIIQQRGQSTCIFLWMRNFKTFLSKSLGQTHSLLFQCVE
jgi:hypothetical protein